MTEPAPAVPSDSAITLPPAVAPLPAPIARHPIASLIVAGSVAIATIVGSIAALNPGSDAPAITAMSARLDAIEKTQGEIANLFTRLSDKLDSRITALEKHGEKVDRYHEMFDSGQAERSEWRRKVMRHIERLERRNR